MICKGIAMGWHLYGCWVSNISGMKNVNELLHNFLYKIHYEFMGCMCVGYDKIVFLMVIGLLIYFWSYYLSDGEEMRGIDTIFC